MRYFLPFIVISIASLMSTPVRSDEEFRSMEFPAAFFFVNKRLTKYAIKAIKVLDKDLCELHCYQENNCVSFNFKKNAEKGEATHICELNNSTHLDHDREFKDDTAYLYKGAKNACGKGKRCENNGICQSGFTDKGYRCVCPEGFEGVHCEQIVDECSINSHSCNVNAVCRAKIGSYVCECNAGYTGDGTSCTDIDECTSGVHDCHSSASCTNTQGSFSCSCDHPFILSGKYCSQPALECQNYNSLTRADRKVTYIPIDVTYCDTLIGPAWYRFQGDAGTQMASVCPPPKSCGTYAQGWLTGGHPNVVDGQVSRTVCFHRSGNCCYWSHTIQVRNCGSFYVYYFNGVHHCSLRYCGTD